MDPAIIGYSKENDTYSHQLNDNEFGAYFIGSNKENKDTSNNTDNQHEQQNDDHDSVNQHLIDAQNDVNDENNKELTPLNGNTKLSFSAKESWSSKQNGTRLYQIPKKRAVDAISDIKSLPSLPPTPSPPRMNRKRNKKYHPPIEPLNDNYTEYNRYSNYYFDDDDYYGHSANYKYDQNWSNRSYYVNNEYYDAYYGSSNSGNDNSSMYPHYSTSYRSNQEHISKSNYGNYSKYGPKAPRFQSESKHHNRNLCKYWSKGAVCKNGSDCPWSHSSTYDDIRKRVTNYKTKPCVDPGRGLKCEYCDRCNFAHPGEALRRPMPIEYSDRQYFKLLLRDCPTNRYPFGIFV